MPDPQPSPPARVRARLSAVDPAAQAEAIRGAHLFDAGWYAARHPEAAADPLAHYLAQAGRAGFEPNPLFDAAWYRAQAPEAAAAGLDPLYHYAVHGVAEALDPHPLFDTAWYLACNDDVAGAGANPLQHYLAGGGPEGRNVHRLFDTGHYLRQRPDVAEAGLNPLLHYLEDGAREGVDPHPLFSTAWYLARHPEVAATGENPLAHYVRIGARQGYDPHPLFDTAWYRKKFPDAGENALLDYLGRDPDDGAEPHPLFDSPWYLEQVPDVAESGANPAIHYLAAGAAAGLNPHPLFDAAHYLAQGPGAEADARANPLLHYLLKDRGAHDPHPLFDAAFYRERNPEARGANPLLHYVTRGGTRDPHPLFDAAFYRAHNDDLAETGRNPLAHFVEGGAAEGRDPHPLFDTSWYLERNPDVAGAGLNALVHYLGDGGREGRDPHPLFDGGWYRSQNPGVTGNPLAHYLSHGIRAAASPNPLFDAAWYRARHPELGPDRDPLVDYIDRGVHIGSEPHPLFHGGWYLRAYPELAGEFETPLHHYLRFGAAEGRDPSPDFSTRWYLARHPDVAEAGLDPLAHYAVAGRAEGRSPLPLETLHARRMRAEAARLAEEIQDIHRHIGLMPVRPAFVVLIGEGDGTPDADEARERTEKSLGRQIYGDILHPASKAEAEALLRARADAYLLWLEPGDTLPVRALYDLACAINRDPETALFTGDEEVVTADGAVLPFHKPGWSPDYLESFDYVGRAACYRGASVADLLEVSRNAFELTLRLTETGARVRHLRRFLLRAPDRRRGQDERERALIAERLARTGRAGPVEAAPGRRLYAVAPGPREEAVTLVTQLSLGPAGEEARAVEALARRIAEIRAETSHRALDAVAVTDRAVEAAGIEALRAVGCAAVPTPDGTGNAARRLNAGAAVARGAFLLFLDLALDPVEPHWIERMLAQFDKPAVGVVGARLLGQDGRIRHAGLVMHDGRPEAVREGNGGAEGYFFSASAARNFFAVSGACLMTRAEAFRDAGGFDAGLGPVLGAVDYCLGRRAAGFRVVYEPGAVLRDTGPHREEAPRAGEAERFDARWGARVADDPYYDAGALRLGPPDYDGRTGP